MRDAGLLSYCCCWLARDIVAVGLLLLLVGAWHRGRGAAAVWLLAAGVWLGVRSLS